MEQVCAEPHEAAELYATGRLDGEAEAAFEEHLLTCRECRERVAWADDLGGAVRRVAAEDAAAHAVVRTGLAVWLARRRGVALLGLAALLLVAFGWVLGARGWLGAAPVAAAAARQTEDGTGGGAAASVGAASARALAADLAAERGARRDLAAQLALRALPQANVAIVTLGLLRGESGAAARPAQVEIGPTPAWMVLAVEAPPAASAGGAPWEAALLDARGAAVWQVGGLRPGGSDTFNLGFWSSLLAPGAYRLRLRPAAAAQGAAAPTVEIPFAVVRRR